MAGKKAFGGKKAAPFPKGGGPRKAIMPKKPTQRGSKGK